MSWCAILTSSTRYPPFIYEGYRSLRQYRSRILFLTKFQNSISGNIGLFSVSPEIKFWDLRLWDFRFTGFSSKIEKRKIQCSVSWFEVQNSVSYSPSSWAIRNSILVSLNLFFLLLSRYRKSTKSKHANRFKPNFWLQGDRFFIPNFMHRQVSLFIPHYFWNHNTLFWQLSRKLNLCHRWLRHFWMFSTAWGMVCETVGTYTLIWPNPLLWWRLGMVQWSTVQLSTTHYSIVMCSTTEWHIKMQCIIFSTYSSILCSTVQVVVELSHRLHSALAAIDHFLGTAL